MFGLVEEFKKRTQLKYITLNFLCKEFGPYLKKHDISFRIMCRCKRR